LDVQFGAAANASLAKAKTTTNATFTCADTTMGSNQGVVRRGEPRYVAVCVLFGRDCGANLTFYWGWASAASRR
jgi:hypothetical protein